MRITKANGDESICGAVLIQACRKYTETDIAVTAAHCLVDRSFNRTDYVRPGNIQVIAGIHNSSISADEPTRAYGIVERFIIHEKYQPGSDFDDIALLVFDETMLADEAARTIFPICLPKGRRGRMKLNEKDLCYAAGWGTCKQLRTVNYITKPKLKGRGNRKV